MGNSILDRAEAHWREIAEEPLGSIEIPEWGTDGKPLVVYVWPCNLRTQRIMHDSIHKDGLESVATVIAMRCRDAERKPIFQLPETIRLARYVDPEVMDRIVDKINELDAAHREQAKN